MDSNHPSPSTHIRRTARAAAIGLCVAAALTGVPASVAARDGVMAARISAVDAPPSTTTALGEGSCATGAPIIQQPPNQSNGLFSDGDCQLCSSGQQAVADNFVLTESTTVAQIILWGGYFPGNLRPATPDPFTVLFHEDAGGLPGAVLDSQVIEPSSAVLTGVELFGVEEVLYTIDIVPVTLPAGTFWVEIVVHSVGNSDQFFWEVGNLDPDHGIFNFAYSQTVPGATWLNGNPVADVAMTLCAGAAAQPSALQIASVAHGVFQAGEATVVAPEWFNSTGAPQSLVGDVIGFTGPAGATYSILDATADYGIVDPGTAGSCMDTADCYALSVTAAGPRPALHWDASVAEEINGGSLSHDWTLHIGQSFSDVSTGSPFYPFIETLLHHGVTTGCSAGQYCGAGTTTRAQMPVFVLVAAEGAGYAPPPCVSGSEMFLDVPASSGTCAWIEELAHRGVVAGCGGGNYCPGNAVNRAQMAVYLLRLLMGDSYTPPACSGIFTDVACPSPFADWIEDLFNRGVTAGCTGTAYCPGTAVNRSQMAVFLSATFSLKLYGP